MFTVMDNSLEKHGPPETQLEVWTIGHSTRSAEVFHQILIAYHIETLVDVRSFPGSRRYPQFNKPELAESLLAIGITYHHMPESKNTAWKNASFRAYADYMETEEFKKGIEQLLELGGSERTAIMCAEAVWWSCHRSLIADYLKSNGVSVTHIIDATHAQTHPYTSDCR